MPYWSIYCFICRGYIADALLECLPVSTRIDPAYQLLFNAQPGAALACPYCNGLIGFDNKGDPVPPQTGWRVFRYGKAELELKKQADGEAPNTSLSDWASRHRLTQPGTHQPFVNYTYAEQAPANEAVP